MAERIENNQIDVCLGLRNITNKEFLRVRDSIKKFYSINDFSFFIPHIKLFSNFISNTKTVNNNNKLFQLVSKKKRFGPIGYSYNAKIKSKSNNLFHKKVFVKELSFFEPPQLEMYYKSISKNMTNISPIGQAVYDGFYNLDNQCNIEAFSTYLTSKLFEEKISPSFCRYFGNYYVNFDKYTFDITNSESIISQLEDLVSIDEDIKYYEKDDELFLQYPNVPGYLLVTEYAQFSIDHLVYNDLITYDLILSIVFQVITAIVTMHSIFGRKHNDLHFGNIMLVKTEDEFIYYQHNSVKYKVPTHGYLVKIIDWGRATYEFNNLKGLNNIYNAPGECFEQYIYQRINNSGLEPISLDENAWTDIVMFSHSVLYEYRDYIKNTDLQRLLTKCITSTDKEVLELKEFDWDLYLDITRYDFKITPNNIINNHVFNKFKIHNKGKNKNKKMKKLPKNAKVYQIIL